jgi:hypothetical protein
MSQCLHFYWIQTQIKFRLFAILCTNNLKNIGSLNQKPLHHNQNHINER